MAKDDEVYKTYLEHAILFSILKKLAFCSEDLTLLENITRAELRVSLPAETSGKLVAKQSSENDQGESPVSIHLVERELERLLQKMVKALRCSSPSEAIEFAQKLKESEDKLEERLDQLDDEEAAIYEKFEKLRVEMDSELNGMRTCLNNLKESVKWDYNVMSKNAEALKLKAEVLECEILAELYSEEKVEALKRIAMHLESEIESVNQEIGRKRKALSQYQVLGPEFHRIVAKYKETQKLYNSKCFVLYQCNDDSFS